VTGQSTIGFRHLHEARASPRKHGASAGSMTAMIGLRRVPFPPTEASQPTQSQVAAKKLESITPNRHQRRGTPRQPAENR